MSIRFVFRIVAPMLAVMTLSACHRPEMPMGEIRTEARQIGSFAAIDVNGSAKLHITVGEKESLSLRGPVNVLEHTTTEVHGDTLRIKTRRKDWVWSGHQSRVTVTITVPHLSLLKLHGGNDVRIAGFKGGDTRIDVEGAAHVLAKGVLNSLVVEMDGAGFADLARLAADDARVTVDGVGRVVVHATSTLNATLNGVGSILYVGSPREVNTEMNGLGSISQWGRHKMKRNRHGNERPWEHMPPVAPGIDHDAEPEVRPGNDVAPDLELDLEVDVDELQPEYDNRPKKIVAIREVI